MTTGQKMEIQNLSDNMGILPMKLGTARTIKAYNNLIHVVRLDAYETNINKIANSLTAFDKIGDLKNSLTILNVKVTELKAKLQTLMPRLRNKRGLVNGLGSVIKSITGNMDADDAIHLNKEIEQLTQGQSTITGEINQLTQINNQMSQRFSNITNHINRQQEIIEGYLRYSRNELNNRIKSDEIAIRYTQYLNQVNYNIDLLSSHLSNIAEAVVLARLNIISKQILNSDELNEIYTFFKNKSIEIKSDEHIYELLGLQAYYNNTNIIFNIQIPQISEETYSFFHIIPLPINNTKMIISKPFAISNPKNIHHFDEKCPKIEGIYYCREARKYQINPNDTCIANLLNNLPAECSLREVPEVAEILQPEHNYVLLINIPETTIHTTCEPHQQKLKGTQLIHFENCQLEINQIIYESNENIYWEDVHIFPSLLQQINVSSIIKSPNIQKLQDHQLKNMRLINTLHTKTTRTSSITIVNSIATFGLILIIIHLLRHHLPTSKKTFNIPRMEPTHVIVAPAPETAGPQFLWPSLHSKGGGVTVTHPVTHA